MGASDEPDQREIAGYSIRSAAGKARWRSLIDAISRRIEAGGARHDIVFHGTSKKRLASIFEDGLRPTEVDLALPDDSGIDEGSFWGDVHTAAAYAEDTSKERDRSVPVLIAIRTDVLLESCSLHPDLASLDFPLKGLTRLDEPGVYEKWTQGFAGLTWKDGLDDLRAIVAGHGFSIQSGDFVLVESVDDLDSLFPAAAPNP